MPTTATIEGAIREVSIDQLDPHPQNPRVVQREDVIQQIEQQIQAAGTFDPYYALLVRPVDGRFQVVSGHNRLEAARRAGLASVPCCVREMDDATAYMALVLNNAQGELSPLEYGIHALGIENRRGKSGGGLQAYAAAVQRDPSTITDLRHAAEVYVAVRNELDQSNSLASRATHLTAIHGAPRETWARLASVMLEKDWTVKDTEAKVQAGFEFLEHAKKEYPPRVAMALDLDLGFLAIALGAHSIRNFDDLVAAYRRMAATFSALAGDDAEALIDEYIGWIAEDLDRALTPKARREKEAELMASINLDETRFRLEAIDFRAAEIEDASVDLIVTDPPYPREFLPLYADLARRAKRVLKPGGLLVAMVGQSYLPEVLAAFSAHLSYHWMLAYLTPGGQAPHLHQRNVNTFWKPILIYVKGVFSGDTIGDVCRSDVNDNDKTHHEWGQSESGMMDLMSRVCLADQLVFDPFMGAGTTGVVAARLGCRFIGTDTSEDHVQTARDRIRAEVRRE